VHFLQNEDFIFFLAFMPVYTDNPLPNSVLLVYELEGLPHTP